MNHLDEHDARALRLDRAMRAFVVKQEPLGAEFEKVLNDNCWALYSKDDIPLASPESAMHLAKRRVALLIAAVAAAWGAAVYLDPWPWLAAWLGAL